VTRDRSRGRIGDRAAESQRDTVNSRDAAGIDHRPGGNDDADTDDAA
jgi:hypothetical protein